MSCFHSYIQFQLCLSYLLQGFPDGSVVKNPPDNAGEMGSIPGLRTSPGEVNDNLLQYSCLENPMDEEPGRLQSMGQQESDMTQQQKKQQYSTYSIVFMRLNLANYILLGPCSDVTYLQIPNLLLPYSHKYIMHQQI